MAPQAPDRKRRRGSRALRRGLQAGLVLLVLVVATIALAIVALSSESTTRWLGHEVEARSGGALSIERLRGTLMGGIAFDRLVWVGATSTTTLDGVAADWSWRPLLNLDVHSLKIARIEQRATASGDDTPSAPPSTLVVPVGIGIEIESLAIDRIEIASATATTVVESVQARASIGAMHRIELASARVEGVSVSGTASLGARAPFPLEANAVVQSESRPQFESLAATAKGSLSRLVIDGSLRLPAASTAAPVALALRVAPFAKAPLQQVEVHAPRLPLRSLLQLPIDATLALDATLEDDGHQGLRGPVSIVNATPGTLDAKRVPVASLQATIDVAAGMLAVDRLRLRLSRDGHTEDGHVEGRASIEDGDRLSIAVDLDIAQVDAQAFSAQLLPSRIDGAVRATNRGDTTTLEASLQGQGLMLDGRARLDGRLLSVERSVLRLGTTPGAGELELSGSYALDAPHRFDLSMLARRFEPSVLMTKVAPAKGAAPDLHGLRWTDTRLDGRIAANGAGPDARGDVDATVEFAFKGSRFANMQVDANGHGGVARKAGQWRVFDANVAIQFDENRLTARGGFGAPDRPLTLVLALAAPRLDRLRALAGTPLRGALNLDATVAGMLENPVIGATFELRGLAVATSLAIDHAVGSVSMAHRRVQAQLQAGPVRFGSTPVDRIALDANGTLDDHVVALEAGGTTAADLLHLRAELAGAWIPESPATGRSAAVAAHWRGQLRSLSNAGRVDLALQSPAALELSTELQRFGPARLRVGGGSASIDSLEHRGDALRGAGSLEGIPARSLALLLPRLDQAANTLTVGGRWRLDVGDRVDAHVELAREGGDLVLGADGKGPLGLSRLGATLDVDADAVRVRFGVTAARLGTADATLATTLSKRDGSFGIAGETPFVYTAKGEFASLGWLALLIDTPVSAEGRIAVDLSRDGPLAAPHLRGQLSGRSLVLRSFDPAGELRDGHFRIDIDQDSFTLADFGFAGRGGGTLTGSGRVALTNESGSAGASGPRPPAADGSLEFRLDRLDALSDPSYHLVTSGDIKLGFSREVLDVSGEVDVDSARITTGDSLAPSLGADVVVTRGAVDDDTVAKPGTTPLPVSVDLKVNLGRDFEVTGFGGDASLRGSMAFSARRGTPLRSVGTINVRKGRYYAYGQSLNIDRGSATFNGPLDDATISFLATRPNLPTDVEVGVEVSGTVREPRIKLVSTPDMSQTEKLSWLVLGRGLDNASGADLQLIGIAASALLGGSNSTPLGSRLGSRLGLDQVDVRSDATTQQTIVSVGKRLSDRLLLTFEQSVQGTSTLAKLRYQAGKRWSIQSTTGSEQAIDVFYTFSFD